MSNKKKIAICFSGQTRHFNDNRLYTEHFYEILNLFDDYDYDLFGHTWADHVNPHGEVRQLFKEYRRDDQEIIWNDILHNTVHNDDYGPNWVQFFQTNKEWYEKSEYMDILNGKSDVSYIDFAKERIKGTVGQVWSAHESFKLTDKHWADNNYQMVIKLRWDLMIKYFSGKDWVNENKKRFKTTLQNWINKEVDFANMYEYPSCLCVDDLIVSSSHRSGSPYVNDHIFAFSGETWPMDRISKKPAELLSSLLLSYMPSDANEPVLPSAHTLWMDWIMHNKFIICPRLPNMFQANGPSEGKINKEWNI